MRADEAEETADTNQKVLSTTGRMQSVQKNTSNDYEDMYKDLSLNKDLLQLSLKDHENDSDDVVPEFSEPVSLTAVAVEHGVKAPVDFAGATYEEYFDE